MTARLRSWLRGLRWARLAARRHDPPPARSASTLTAGSRSGCCLSTIMTGGGAMGGPNGGDRRCDAKCHQAQKPDCDCICGGRYHGKGSSDAAQKLLTEDFMSGEGWWAGARKQKGKKGLQLPDKDKEFGAGRPQESQAPAGQLFSLPA